MFTGCDVIAHLSASLSIKMADKIARSKSRNWSVTETGVLVDFVVSQYPRILTRGFWEEAATIVNSQSYIKRLPHEVRRKWIDLKSLTKKKAIKYKQQQQCTGGGPPPEPPTEVEEKVMSVLPSVTVEGVSSEGDIFKENNRTVQEKEKSGKDLSSGEVQNQTVPSTSYKDPDMNTAGKKMKVPACSSPSELVLIEREILQQSKLRNEILSKINSNLETIANHISKQNTTIEEPFDIMQSVWPM